LDFKWRLYEFFRFFHCRLSISPTKNKNKK
jgi:hypothetical protein